MKKFFNDSRELIGIQKYSRDGSKEAIFARIFDKSFTNLLKNAVFQESNVSFLDELESINNKYNTTIQAAIKRNHLKHL